MGTNHRVLLASVQAFVMSGRQPSYLAALARPLALRPRLATGLPWTALTGSASAPPMDSFTELDTCPGATTASTASTMRGSNCVPEHVIELLDRVLVRDRRAVRAVGAHRVPRVAAGDDARLQRDGLARPGRPDSRPPSQRSWWERTISPTSRMKPPTRSSIRWPSTVWVWISRHSSGSSRPGLLMISFGIAILPTSCSSAPNSRLRRRSASSPSSSATASASWTTPLQCSPV